jgi:hypothetical protein
MIDIEDDAKCSQIAGHFKHHADGAVKSAMHRLMVQILGFTRSHWMPPSGDTNKKNI